MKYWCIRRNCRHEISFYGASLMVLLTYETIKQQVLFKKKLSYAQPMQEVISKSRPLMHVCYVTVLIKHE
jgi:hypothetical protein